MTRLALVPDPPQERAARWFRVSSDGQDERHQFAEVDTHCEQCGYEVAKTFRLHDVSASKGQQESALQEALQDIHNGAYTVIVVAHSSRLDRRDPDIPMLFQILVRKAGGRIESVREPEFGKGTLTGRMLTILATEGNFEYTKTLRANVLAAMATVAANGALWGKPCWGFTSEGPKRNRRLVATSEARTYVPQIFARVTAGQSLATVAKWLESEHVAPMGIKKEKNADGTPVTRGKSGQWHARSVGALIRNPTMMGMRVSADGQTVTECEALVNAAVWAAAGERLDHKQYRGTVVKENRCYLSAASRCRWCDGPLYKILPRGKKGEPRVAQLRCSGTGAHRTSCTSPANMVELATAEALADEVIGSLQQSTLAITTVPGNGPELAAELARLEFQRRQVAMSGLGWDELEAELARLRQEWERVNATERTPDHREIRPTGESYGDWWRRMSVDERADFLRSHVTIYFAQGRQEQADAVSPDGSVSLFLTWADDLPDA